MSARIALSEVLAALSYALDLTDGQPAGHTMRACLIGMRIGRELGLGTEERSVLYYTLLLKDAGCSGNASRLCDVFGTDDRVLKPRMRAANMQSALQSALAIVRTVGVGRGTADKLRHFIKVAASDRTFAHDVIRIRCDRGADIAARLGFPAATADGVRYLDEAWNGHGQPYGLAGEAIPLAARIASLAQTLEMFHHAEGIRAALAVARRRRGTAFDPTLVDVVAEWRHDDAWWERLECTDLAPEVMAEEPVSHVRWVDEAGLDAVARAFADIIDAKSPYTFSHSRNVASYALAITRMMGFDLTAQRRIYRAGLLHDIGKLGVSNTILDKIGPLSADERAVVERHPIYTWEILSRVPAFRNFAWPAALHHERLDGAGYPWRLSGNRIDVTARILAVADVYEALTADRPYRSGISSKAASQILAEGRGRSFDGTVLDALDACVSAQRMDLGLEPQIAA